MSPKNAAQETKFKQLLIAWNENKGNWLLAVGLVVCILASVVGYFDLIPDIRTHARSGYPNMILSGKTLDLRITGCISDQGQVVAMLYDGQSFSDSSVPIRIQNLEIEGGEATWAIHNLSYGPYAIYAFHDVDVNDTVDPKNEPQGLSRSGKLNSVEQEQTTFEEAVFEFSAGQNSVVVRLKTAST